MKKVFLILIFASTFLLFSCASKKTAEDENSAIAPENTEVLQNDSSINDENSNSTGLDENKQEESVSIDTEVTPESSIDSEGDKNSDSISVIEDNLTEIEEPEVFELEPAAEIETTEQDDAGVETQEQETTAESTDIPEVVPEEDLITPEIEEDEVVIEESQDNDEVENLLEESENQEVLSENTEASNETETIDEISEEENEGPDPEESKLIIPSRSMSVNKLEYIDITYPGKGWVFMGLTDNSKNLTYLGRKIGTNDTKFTLQARNAGTYVLHFYKNDSVTNEYLDDYLEIVISDEKNLDKVHIEAPKYVPLLPEQKKAYIEKLNAEKSAQEEVTEPAPAEKEVSKPVVEEKKNQPVETKKVVEEKKEIIEAKQEPVQEANKNTKNPEKKVVETPVLIEQTPDPNLLYNEALSAYKANDLSNAEQKLLLGIEYATSGKDKYLFLLGQIYEKESAIQNINKAIEEYTILVNNYPASSYWDKANKRIIYLKRFYIEGR